MRWLKGLGYLMWWVIAGTWVVTMLYSLGCFIVHHPIAAGVPTLVFIAGLMGMKLREL